MMLYGTEIPISNYLYLTVPDRLDLVSVVALSGTETQELEYSYNEGTITIDLFTMEELKPGKEVTETVVLTKTINSDETLTIENLAEIGSATNTEGLEEKDSTPANKKDKEDDLGKAELIVSIKTGGTWMYIGIVLVSLVIISAGILLINKKVLKDNI